VAYGRNRVKSQVRAKVEAVIGVTKQIFGFAKVRYRGLAKMERGWDLCLAVGDVTSAMACSIAAQKNGLVSREG
jgi:hypothetical protein